MELLEDAGDFEGTATELLEVLEAMFLRNTANTVLAQDTENPFKPHTPGSNILETDRSGSRVCAKADASRQRIIRIQEDF